MTLVNCHSKKSVSLKLTKKCIGDCQHSVTTIHVIKQRRKKDALQILVRFVKNLTNESKYSKTFEMVAVDLNYLIDLLE